VLRFIQVGMGSWGRDWAATVLPQVPEARVVGYVDDRPEAREQVRRSKLPDAGNCRDSLVAALQHRDADAVLVTTDLPSHVSVVSAALQAGKHVLVEKPLAPSMTEAREVVHLADELGLVLMVSQNYRFFPAVRAAQRLVRDGTLGKVFHVDVDFRRFSSPLSVPPAAHRNWAQPLLVDMSIHHFDLLRAVLGSDPTAIHCRTWNPPWAGYRDPPEGSATIAFGDDLSVSYRGSWICPDRRTLWAGEWRMEFEQGEVWWTSRGDRSTGSEDAAWSFDHHAQRRELALPEVPLVDRAGSLDAFVTAIDHGRVPETSGRDNLKSLALTYASVESARRREQVTMGEVT
jgi:predicted dehydrogenase